MELFTFLTFLIVICLIKKRLFESEKNPSNEKRISDDINITENPGIVNVVEDKTVETVTQKKVEKKAKDKPIIKLDLTKDPILQKTVRLIEEGKNIFITGGAGTGKSYMLQQLKIYFGIDLQLTSTTGISAININGSTIHSWAGLGIEQNGVWGCRYHHHMLDNGKGGYRKEMLKIMEIYLKSIYPNWDKKDLVYKKWG